MSGKQSYRLDELAARWSTSVSTIKRMIRRGVIAAFKVGATWRVRAEEVLAYEKNSQDGQRRSTRSSAA